ncbi:MAG TPA: glycine cleavage T C-terminal barrel domain-containing protein, partial [Casimicrobiaceae bacterium]
YAVALDKPGAFIGRDALLRTRELPPAKRLLHLHATDPADYLWGGEPVLVDGEPAGEVTSAGYSRRYGCAVAFAYVRGAAAGDDDALMRARLEFDVGGTRVGARIAPANMDASAPLWFHRVLQHCSG